MAKEDILLRDVINPPLVTKGSALTFAEFDGNMITLYNALVELSQSSNVPPYNNAENYYLNDYVLEGLQLYKCIVAGPIVNVTPSTTPGSWKKVYATDLVEPPKKYLEYNASISQSGTSDPVVNYEDNGFENSVLIERDAVGSYTLNSVNAFTDVNKIMVFLGDGEEQVLFKWFYVDNDEIAITTSLPAGEVPSDGLLSYNALKIQVYK